MDIRAIGHVESPLTDRSTAPRQGDEGVPEAWLIFDPAVQIGLRDLRTGQRILVLTWLDRTDRSVLEVRPRRDPERRMHGVFSTRSPDRPNPIGLHEVTIVAVESPTRFRVSGIEAIDGTPIIDVKPALEQPGAR